MEQLWSKRFSVFIQDRIFILKRLANGFSIVPLLLFLLGLYYYPMLLERIPNSFFVHIVVVAIITFSVARGSYRSFLLESDTVYLTPVESDLKSFFMKTYIYNVIVQAFFVFALLVILSPLYFAKISGEVSHFVLFVLIILLLKAWNVFFVWQEINGENRLLIYLRWGLNAVFVYGLVEQQLFILILSAAMFLGLYGYIRKSTKSARIHWLHLVKVEQRLDAQFYRWMGQFVDHPYAESTIKSRKWLNTWMKHYPKKHENAFAYLYMKLFLRTETIGIVFRITVIGMLLFAFIDNIYVAYALYVLLIVMVGMQLTAFWQVYITNFWIDLYPIDPQAKRKDFITSTYFVLLLAVVLLPIPALIVQFTWLNLLMFSLISLVIPFLFIHLYVAKKIA